MFLIDLACEAAHEQHSSTVVTPSGHRASISVRLASRPGPAVSAVVRLFVESRKIQRERDELVYPPPQHINSDGYRWCAILTNHLVSPRLFVKHTPSAVFRCCLIALFRVYLTVARRFYIAADRPAIMGYRHLGARAPRRRRVRALSIAIGLFVVVLISAIISGRVRSHGFAEADRGAAQEDVESNAESPTQRRLSGASLTDCAMEVGPVILRFLGASLSLSRSAPSADYGTQPVATAHLCLAMSSDHGARPRS